MSAFLGLVAVEKMEVDAMESEDCDATLWLTSNESLLLRQDSLSRQSSSPMLLSSRFTWPAMK